MPQRKPHGLLGHYAGFASRFVALLIDGLIISLSITAITLATFTVQALMQLVVLIEATSDWGFLSSLIKALADPAPALVVLMIGLFVIIYQIFFVSTAGRTPGKAFMGLRVLTTDGRKLSPLRASIRLLGYLVSALPIFAGFFWVLLDDRRQAWHDKLAATYVVYAWAARPDEAFLSDEIQSLSTSPQEQ